MDGDRFDSLAKLVAITRTRRGVLKVGLGGIVAGLAGAFGLRPAAPVAAFIGQVCSVAGVGPCQEGAAAEYHVRVKDCAQNFGETAYTKLACLGGALEDYRFAQARCTPQSCDASACEVCGAAGTCQAACAAGVACVGGRCGCPSDQTRCGTSCCDADQACCAHACCDHGITSCNPDGSCACPDGEKPCNGACIAATNCCTAADCPPNNVCQGGTCQQVGCKPLGETCGGDGECCSGLCQFNACATTTTTSTTTAPPTTTTTTTAAPTTTTTTTTTTPGCLPSGTQVQCSAFNQGACCSGHCQGGSVQACNQQAAWDGCCELDGAACTGRSGVNPACCGGYCAMNPGQTTGVCQSSALGQGQACGAAIDCASCACAASGACQ